VNLAQASAITFTIQSFVTLLVIMDPPGATPIFLSLVADKSAKVRRQLAVQAALVSLLVISVFALFGRLILSYLNVSIEALQGAGGLLLLLISLELLTGRSSENSKSENAMVGLPVGVTWKGIHPPFDGGGRPSQTWESNLLKVLFKLRKRNLSLEMGPSTRTWTGGINLVETNP
jgi:hypothetical protein